MAVLVELDRRSGEVVSKEQLLNTVWPDTVVSDAAVSRCIYQLRRGLREVLPDDDGTPIETLAKRGYRLNVSLRFGLPEQSGEGVANQNSIAVLPFVDMSANRDQEYLADGIAEELINGLSKLEQLRVTARTSSFRFKGRDDDVRSIAGALGVAAVLEGSVRKSGDRLRITAQLIDARDGSHRWSETYDHETKDIFALQDDVARNVIAALRVKLRPPSLQRVLLIDVGTEDAIAYDCFLHGMHEIRKFTKESDQRALESFRRATERDPDYANAFAGLGWACTSLIGNHGAPREEYAPIAQQAYRRAEALGWEHPLHTWDELYRMIEPDTAPLDEHSLLIGALGKLAGDQQDDKHFSYCQLARCLSRAGFFQAGLDFYQRYLALNGYSLGQVVGVENELRWCLSALGRYGDAIERWNAWIDLEPDAPMHRVERSYVLCRARRWEAAEQDVAFISAQWRRNFPRFYMLLNQGDTDTAREYFQLIDRNPKTVPFVRGYGRLLLGDIEGGLDYLEELARTAYLRIHRGRDRHWEFDLHLARFCPSHTVAAVRAHPRYRVILESTGLTDLWREEMADRCNALSHVTGINVSMDELNSAAL